MSNENKSPEEMLLGSLLNIFIGLPLSLCLSWFYGGYVLSCLWLWFVVPVFGLPELNVLQASGLMMAVAAFSGAYSSQISLQQVKSKLDITPSMFIVIVWTAAFWTLTLFFGYILHLFIIA